jgi:FAD/FMN-containing dehydrogenase
MNRICPGDPDWDTARMAWNVAVDQRPAAVVTIRDQGDVVAAIRDAAAAGLAVTAQPNGHGATSALDGTVLLRTANRAG